MFRSHKELANFGTVEISLRDNFLLTVMSITVCAESLTFILDIKYSRPIDRVFRISIKASKVDSHRIKTVPTLMFFKFLL